MCTRSVWPLYTVFMAIMRLVLQSPHYFGHGSDLCHDHLDPEHFSSGTEHINSERSSQLEVPPNWPIEMWLWWDRNKTRHTQTTRLHVRASVGPDVSASLHGVAVKTHRHDVMAATDLDWVESLAPTARADWHDPFLGCYAPIGNRTQSRIKRIERHRVSVGK